MRVIRERMVELDFKEEFIEKILKEYSTKKIDEKLDLLMERKNIKNPTGWLRAALKNDYHDPEQEIYDEEPAEGSNNLVNTPEQVSRETVLKAIKLIQDNFSTRISPSPPGEESRSERKCRGSIHRTRLFRGGFIRPLPLATCNLHLVPVFLIGQLANW